jgi:hypothetical protein
MLSICLARSLFVPTRDGLEILRIGVARTLCYVFHKTARTALEKSCMHISRTTETSDAPGR